MAIEGIYVSGIFPCDGSSDLAALAQVAQFVAKELGVKLNYEMHDQPSTRPGHDLRYALDGSKLKAMGWKLPLTFEESLRKCIRWTVNNPAWLDMAAFNDALHPSEQVHNGNGAQAIASKL